MDIFFSWSGHFSKKVAQIIKTWLIEEIFPDAKLSIFISEEDIEFGSEWYDKIREKLLECKIGFVFLTQENVNAPWLYFEAGAIAIGENHRSLIVCLTDLDKSSIKSPLKHYYSLCLSKESLKKLVLEIKEKLNINSSADKHLNLVIDNSYDELKNQIESSKQIVDSNYYKAPENTFPEHIKKIKKGKVFIGAPMASIDEKNYIELREICLTIQSILSSFNGISEVYYPGNQIHGQSEFDGETVAIIKDFKMLKESEFYLFIYPQKVVTSVLCEMGYAIATMKNTVIFVKRNRKSLPYMLKQADKAISNLKIYEFDRLNDVVDIVKKNGNALFDSKIDEVKRHA
jgi:hypothetical protein